MRLHKELDPESQSAWRHMVHLLADPVPQIQPELLPFIGRVLQAKVVHLDYPQLPAYLTNEKLMSSVSSDIKLLSL